MKKFRTILAWPFLGAFYASIMLTGFIAWIANGIAGYGGLVAFNAIDVATGEDVVNVDLQ
jgi:hypothetical protein